MTLARSQHRARMSRPAATDDALELGAADRAWHEQRDEVSRQEAARYTAEDGSYAPRPPSDAALDDLLEHARNGHGEWMRETPGGHWFDLVEAARELKAARAAKEG